MGRALALELEVVSRKSHPWQVSAEELAPDTWGLAKFLNLLGENFSKK